MDTNWLVHNVSPTPCAPPTLLFSDGHLGHIFPDGPMRGSLDVNELQTVPESDPKLGYKVQRGIVNDDDNDAIWRPLGDAGKVVLSKLSLQMSVMILSITEENN